MWPFSKAQGQDVNVTNKPLPVEGREDKLRAKIARRKAKIEKMKTRKLNGAQQAGMEGLIKANRRDKILLGEDY